jgi:hypothetical protein
MLKVYALSEYQQVGLMLLHLAEGMVIISYGPAVVHHYYIIAITEIDFRLI